MSITVRQLAELVRGTVSGDAEFVVQSARPLQDAQPGDITFVESDKYLPQLQQCQAGAAIVSAKTTLDAASMGKVLILTADPLMAFVAVYQFLQGKAADTPTGIDPRADVPATTQVGADASIQAFVSVGANTVIGKRCKIHSGVVIGRNCRLGDDVVLFPNVVLYDDSVLGDRVIIHANSVIGADGFGYRFHQGRHVKVPQLSHVEIGNDVEIGACSTVDRGVFGPTRIGEGSKFDNHVQVAHNCQIGKHNLLAALVGVGGSTTTGDYVTLAGQVGVADHVTIGTGSIVGAQSGVTSSLSTGARVLGMPARPIHDQRRILATEEKLPEMRRDLQRIKKQMGIRDEEAAA